MRENAPGAGTHVGGDGFGRIPNADIFVETAAFSGTIGAGTHVAIRHSQSIKSPITGLVVLVESNE